jgi:NNP family nitrate/nitrite transporter-like MFS transporter
MNKTNSSNSANRWLILILGGLTNAVVVALQTMSLSVLLPQITTDFGLTVTQAGLLWGIGSFPMIFSSFLAGTLLDRFGGKRIIIGSCLVLGLVGALRGLAPNYPILLVTILLFGFFAPFINIGNIKVAGNWFKNQELGIANGVLALGMASGFFIGSMISASYVSPWIGGWRNTFLLFGFVSGMFIFPWFFVPKKIGFRSSSQSELVTPSWWGNINHVIRIKNILLLGLTIFCLNGAVQGFLGYIPLYLRNSGWQATSADSLAASFHLASMLFVIPLTLLSDKLGVRKKIIIPALIIISISIGSFSIFKGELLWLAVLMAGFARDGIMAILFTMTLETKGIGEAFSATGSSLMVVLASLGGLVAPPAGNALANLAPDFPFIFWAALCILGALTGFYIQENKKLQEYLPSK